MMISNEDPVGAALVNSAIWAEYRRLMEKRASGSEPRPKHTKGTPPEARVAAQARLQRYEAIGALIRAN